MADNICTGAFFKVEENTSKTVSMKDNGKISEKIACTIAQLIFWYYM